MARSLNLTRQPYRADGGSYRYVYTAANTGSPVTPPEIFVMQVTPLNVTTGTKSAGYSNVASPAQLQDLPVNAVVGNGTYYRVASYEALYTSRDDADVDWAALQAAVRSLLRSLKAADAALTTETVSIAV